DAGEDRAAQVLAARRHHVERGGGAEVHDDAPLAQLLVRGDRVDDAVGADLARVLVKDRHPRLDPRPDDERGHAEALPAQRLDGEQRRRHHRGDDGGGDAPSPMPSRPRRPASSAAYSSEVRPLIVSSRQWPRRTSPSYTPSTVLVLPTSTTSSIR